MNCVLCGKNDKEILFKLSSNMKILSPAFKKSETFLVNCNCCGNTFVDIDATQNDFNDYYKSESARSLSYYEVYGEKASDMYFTDVLNNFRSYISKDSAIIDVASGVGDFSCFLNKNGYKNVTALDISERCIKSLDEKNIKSIHSDIAHIDSSEHGKYDVAVLLHSLEHFLDFKSCLEAVKKIVKPNGVIYIETPDASKYCDVDAVPFTFFTYEHTFHLTQDTMKNIGCVCGLECVNTGSFFKADSYWVVYGVFINEGAYKEPFYTDTTKLAISKYIDFSRNLLKKRLPKSTETKYYLWGIGASTALLLSDTFDDYNIIGLIDRNPARQGLEYKIHDNNLVVQTPDAITDKEAVILVLPYWYKDSILKQIKDMKIENPVKVL